MNRYAVVVACALLALPGLAQAQTTTLAVVVGPEAALSVTTATTSLATTSSTFGSSYAGTTTLGYTIRTTKSSGTGTITVQITSDFNGAGGPSVANPPTAGDALTYTCSVSTPGTPCSGSQTAATKAATAVANFGAGASSSKSGNAASVAWSLTDDPIYATGTYSATATFTISAT
ncbi:MAG TPA: hypothetical protein VMT86_06460 [Bryobacteraceae bacterium]|nr:hypothetical protein [Bryobacteraceae bacterium]